MSHHEAAATSSEAHGRRARRNLVVVIGRHRNHRESFQEIARHVRSLAPEIRPILLRDRSINNYRRWLSLRPTLVVSARPVKRFKPRRGAVLTGEKLKKSGEYEVLERAGVAVPKWARLSEGYQPDLSGFGKYVVCKPDLGGKGAEVKIRRKTRVRWKPYHTYMGFDGKECLDLVVQEFIYTGPWPVSYRVSTFFGKTLYAWKAEASHARRPLSGPDKFGEGGASGGGMSIVSTGSGCTFELTYDREVIELAERAHAALPHHPVLGVDIIREQPSGKLYVVEVNSGGEVWHFSSPTGRKIQSEFNLNLDGQFGGLRLAAERLVELTRRHAR